MTKNLVTLHIQGRDYAGSPWIGRSMEALARWVEWVWLINPPEQQPSPFPHQKVGARLFLSADWDRFEREAVADGKAGADRWWQRIAPDVERIPYAEVIQGPNEPAVQTYDQRMALVEFTLRAVEHFHRAGRQYGGGVFGVGWLGGESEAEGMDWLECIRRDTLQCLPIFSASDYIISHNYGKRVGKEWTELAGWTLRFAEIHKALEELGWRGNGAADKPWLITEGGMDISGDKTKSGWRGPGGPSMDQYAGQIMAVNDLIAAYPYVKCYALFTALTDDWISFAILRDLWDRLERSIVERDPTNDVPAPGPLPMPSDELAYTGSLAVLAQKTRWWIEESIRQGLEPGGNRSYGAAILRDLPTLALVVEQQAGLIPETGGLA